MIDERLGVRLVARSFIAPLAPRRGGVELRTRRTPAERISARPLVLRDAESPSSLEKLLGCSVAWALHYHGWVRSGLGGGPRSPSPLLYGTVAHYFLDRVFGSGPLSPDSAARRAEDLLERHLAEVCETLALPDHQAERATVKRAVVETARRVAALIEQTGATIVGTEIEIERDFGSIRLKGKVDLLLSTPDVVIDFKWGQTTNKRRLESGAALQLAAYAEMRRDGARRPAIAYFILNNQRLLAEPRSGLPGAQCPGSATADDTWAGARIALATRLAELAAGKLHAPAATGGDPAESFLAGGVLAIGPSCGYCEHGVLCGRGGMR
jgi:ATP-dependent helicase/nuclease subunit B